MPERSCSRADPLYLPWVWNTWCSFSPRALPHLPFTCMWASVAKLAVSFNIEGFGEKEIKACHGCLAGSLTHPAPRLSSACSLLYRCLVVGGHPVKAQGGVPRAVLDFCQPLPPTCRKQAPSATSRYCLYVCARSVCTDSSSHPMLFLSETSVAGS